MTRIALDAPTWRLIPSRFPPIDAFETAASAEDLHVHRNTLDYRLRRIAELTGLDLGRLDDCLLLFIGLELDDAED